MAKIRNIVLPEPFTNYLISLLQQVPDGVLVPVGRQLLPGGFTQAETLRERLKAKILGPGTLESWMVVLLRQQAPGHPTVELLTLPALQKIYEPLTAFGGRGAFAAAMMLDPREEVQKFGAEMLAKGVEQEATDEEKKAAARALCEFVNEHFLAVAEIKATADVTEKLVEREYFDLGDGEKASVDEVFENLEKLRRIAESRMKENEALKRGLSEQSARQKSRLEQAQRHAAVEKKRLVTDRESARQQVARLLKENKALMAQMAEMSQTQETVVARRVEEMTSALARKWLIEPMTLEQRAGTLGASSDDLLSRAEQALEAQARQDRFSGNRLELERRLAQLREARERLLRAAQSALCPVTQLKEVLAEVEAQMAHLEKMLSGRRPADVLTERLLMAINHAGDRPEARRQGDLIEELVEMELVPKEERRLLFQALERKFSLLEEAARLRGTQEAARDWSLRDVLFRNVPSVVLLDGHNILFGLEDVFQPFYEEDGHPARRARDHLVELMRRMLAGHEQVRARICFDAPVRETVQVSPNLTIEFSGGRGEHRADRCIHEHVTERRPEEVSWKYFVVSDDRAVRRDARKNGAQVVPADVLAVLLNDLGCLTPAEAKAA